MIVSDLNDVDKGALLERLRSEVHVWFFRTEIEVSEKQRTIFFSQLSADEGQRYHSFHYDEDKKNYLIAHVLLRNILSKYVGISAEEWLFTCNQHGKPEIDKQSDLPNIDFNITHTKGLCSCVFTLNATVGIDAENVGRSCNYKALARRMFSDEETASIDLSDDPYQQFYKLWTLREAYVKALGSGLSGSSKKFSFVLDDNDESISLHNEEKMGVEDDCLFFIYRPTDEHVMSIAIKKKRGVAFRSKKPLTQELMIQEILPDDV